MLLSQQNSSSLLAILGFVGMCAVAFGATPRQDNKTQPVKKTTGNLKQTSGSRNPKDGAELCFIPAGKFTMGDNKSPFDDEKQAHEVMLTHGYYMYKYPVTVGQYEQFIKEMRQKGAKRLDGSEWKMPEEPLCNGSNFNPGWSKKDHPIVNVSWDDAIAYCAWASGDQPGSVTLPTEAEWERAMRGGVEGRQFPWGGDFDASKLWSSKSSKSQEGDAGGTASVRRTRKVFANAYGLVDMAGNVWQWCRDYYDEKFYNNAQADVPDPENRTKGEEGYRVLRGGSWIDSGTNVFRCVNRNGGIPGLRIDDVGFRCVVRSK